MRKLYVSDTRYAGRVLYAQRMRMGFVQQEVASRLKLSDTQISALESGTSGWTFARIAELSNIFGVSPEIFFKKE